MDGKKINTKWPIILYLLSKIYIMSTVDYVLKDSYPDGWNGNTLKFSKNGSTMYTLGESFTFGATYDGNLDMECGDYTVTCGGGDYLDEISFTLTSNDGVILDGICDQNVTYDFNPCSSKMSQEFCDNNCKMISYDMNPEQASMISTNGDSYCEYWASAHGWCGTSLYHKESYGGTNCNECSSFNRTVNFNLKDKMNDGWNGNTLNIFKDNNFIRSVSFDENSGQKDVSSTLACAEYTFVCDSGDYPDETSFTISVDNQIIVDGNCHGAKHVVNICN